jgi:radical SAM protein with 4Fe4S-binding SPASM domain
MKQNNIEKISISAVLPNNYDIYNEFYKLGEDLNVKASIRHFSHEGRAGENYKNIELEMKNYLINRGKESKKIIDWKAYIQKDKKFLKTNNCGGFENTLSISSSGEIYPCNLLMKEKYSLGNILEIKNIHEYINSEEFVLNEGYKNFQRLKNYKYDECEICKVRNFCWSCPAEYDDLLGREEIFKNRCNEVKEDLVSVVWG